MDGILHVIEQFGLAHRAALAEVQRLAAENSELRSALAAAAAERE